MDVEAWLKGLGLEQYAEAFAENDVDAETLAKLTAGDLQEIGVKSVGHRRKLLEAITRLGQDNEKSEFAPNARAALRSPATYTPEHLAERILQSRSVIEGERKQVTVLFADIKGSLELIKSSDPEDAQAIFDQAIQTMMEAVHRYEGTVNKVLGDGIMALFGAPLAHEDHAARACYAALAMQRAIGAYAETARQRHGVEVQARVGLNSGEVVVRAIGNDLSMDYDAIGACVHLASRMEQLAVPGAIRLTAQTLRLAEGFIEVKPLGPVPVKGLADPVEAFDLTGAGAARTRLQAALARGLTRFVGRDPEIETLGRVLEKAGDGHGQIVALVGEPGVGKSRLFYEFTHSHRTSDWLILESASVSYGKATAWLPVIDLLKTYFRIDDGDDQRRVAEKVAGKLIMLDETLKPTLPAFLALLDVAVEDADWQALEPPQRRRRTLDAVRALLVRESQVQPLVVMFEDLHWVDGETQALLDGLAEGLPTCRILLLVNYRPEYEHGWGGRTYYTLLRVDPLGQESADELLATLLGTDASLAPLKPMLVERAEGNPFFLEESVRTLVETGVLAGEPAAYRLMKDIQTIVVPATVQGILASRIDRLSRANKRLLQTAAVIGKDVSYALLHAIADLPEDELRRGLADLQAAEFLYEVRLFPDLEYTFKHAHTHEVAYGNLLQERRRELHRRIAEAIEAIFAGRLAEQVQRLAYHYTKADLTEQAIGYWHKAGQRAGERSANLEAIAHCTKGLELVKSLPETPERAKQELALFLTLGPALMATKGWSAPEAEEAYLRARELCRQVGKPTQLFTVTWGLWLVYQQGGQLEIAQDLADEVLALAERQSEPAFLLQAHHAAWTTRYRLADFAACRDHTEQGIALYSLDEHRFHAFRYGGHDPGMCARVHASLTSWTLGRPDQALETACDAEHLAEELSYPYTLTLAWLYRAIIHQYRQEADLALERAEAVIALSAEHGFAQLSGQGRVMRGWAEAARGQAEAGMAEMRQGLMVSHPTGAGARRSYFLPLLAEANGRIGASGKGLSALAEALDLVEKTGERTWEAEVHRLKGELLLIQSANNRAEVEGCLNKATEVARGQSAKSLELRAATSLARLRQERGESGQARELLAPVYDWFTEGFDTADLKDAKALLDDLA